MDIHRAFEPVLSVILGGKLPANRDSVAACSAHVAFAVLEHVADGETRLGTELNHLFKALQNFEDPALSELGVMERVSMRTLLGAVRKLKGLSAQLSTGMIPDDAARNAAELLLTAVKEIADARSSPEEDAEEGPRQEPEDRGARRPRGA